MDAVIVSSFDRELMSNAGGSGDLPTTVEQTHRVVRIQPAATPVNPETVSAQFRRLHRLLHSRRRWRPRPKTLEIRLTTTDDGIAYDVGIDEEAQHDALARLLEGLFPDSYTSTETVALDHALRVGPDVAPVGIEFRPRLDHPKDWQTRLRPFERCHGSSESHRRVPLTDVLETMAAADVPMVFQCLLRPRADFTPDVDERRLDIEHKQDSFFGTVINTLVGNPDPEAVELTESERQRIDELASKESRHCFDLAVRAVALPEVEAEIGEAESRIAELETAFAGVGHTSFGIEAHRREGADAETLLEAMRARAIPKSRLPWRSIPVIVADPTEVANFCVIDGTALTDEARRAVAVTPGERTAITTPPPSELAVYQVAY